MNNQLRTAMDLLKANETGTARVSAMRRVMLATPVELEMIIEAYQSC